MTEEEDEEEDIIKPVAKKQTEQQPIKRSHHKQGHCPFPHDLLAHYAHGTR